MDRSLFSHKHLATRGALARPHPNLLSKRRTLIELKLSMCPTAELASYVFLFVYASRCTHSRCTQSAHRVHVAYIARPTTYDDCPRSCQHVFLVSPHQSRPKTCIYLYIHNKAAFTAFTWSYPFFLITSSRAMPHVKSLVQAVNLF